MNLGPRYRMRREIGKGGWGRVFLVRDRYLRRDLALKLIDRAPAGPDALKQAENEFALLARIEHPRVAKSYDFGQIEGRPYFTAEYIRGRSMAACIDDAAGETLIRFMADVAEAVAFLHRHHLLHLDIKPTNVMIREEGPGAGSAVLIDFGLFRRGVAGEGWGTMGKEIRGSLPYMAPELFRKGQIGPWTDVYALGVTFYRMAAGKLPRWSDAEIDLEEVFHGSWDPAPPVPDPRRRDLPADVAQIISKCLSLDHAHRFPSARECLDSILRLIRRRPTPARGAEGVPAVTLGRASEMAEVDAFLDRVARASSPRGLLVTGAAGMGQSHFLREVKVRALTKGFRFYLESGHPGMACRPGSLLRFLGVPGDREGLPQRRVAARWRSFLARLGRPRSGSALEIGPGERRLRHGVEVSLAASAVRSPTVLAVDGLQLFDEVSVELLISLVHLLGDDRDPAAKGSPGQRSHLGVILGYREEGPAEPLLQELSRHLMRAGAGSVLTLQPLGVEEALRLYRDRGPPDPTPRDGLQVFQETGGSPAKIVALAASRTPAARGGVDEPRGSSARRLPRPHAEALGILVALRRPALLHEAALFLGLPRGRTADVLAVLETEGLAREVEPGRWQSSSRGDASMRRDGTGLRKAHERIASGLLRTLREREDASRVEAVQHLMSAGRAKQTVEEGLRAARYLKSTYQSRAALDLSSSILELIPRRRKRVRLEIAMDMARLYAVTGAVDKGIRLLREMRLESKRFTGGQRARVLLLLAVLHSRKGELKIADSLFREGLGMRISSRAGELAREETLHFLNEHAALKMFIGEYDDATRICTEGLRKARGGRSVPLREASLNLQATLANVALRVFDFDAAIRGLEKALCAAEAIGSLGNQAVILNNLGKVYSQCDRHDEAIAAFQHAEETCLRIDAGPSLVAVHGNLAILNAKTGRPEPAERALAEARRISLAGLGPRESFFLEHAAGLSRLFQGRYAEARSAFQAAIAAGRTLGDRHVVEFDEVYRAEALLFEARYPEAESELTRLGAPPTSARARKMALARRSLLASFLGDREGVLAAMAAYGGIEARPVPFLDAWDGLFLGWALSLAGERDTARGNLDLAEAFFRERGLRPLHGLARMVRVEGMLLERSGENEAPSGAANLLEGIEHQGNRLASAFFFLLGARLGWSTDRRKGAERRAGLLAEAGAALVGNPLPEWQARIESLSAALRSGKAEVEPRVLLREEIAAGLDPRARKAYMEAPYWRMWARAHPGATSATGSCAAPGKGSPDPVTKAIESRTTSARRARDRLIGRSRSMKKLLSRLERVAGSDVSVLILGETGVGKETVARAIHEESRRKDGPFTVVDCASLPEALLEVELGGACKGAYTDQTADREGILLGAAGGTVLLDGIEHLSLHAQAKLLRIIAERRVRPVGGEEEVPVDVRILASSGKDLVVEARAGRFRPDLLHRVQVMTLEVPPLRERTEDLPDLVARLLEENGISSPPVITPGAWRCFESRPWPGNVRELANVVARLSVERKSEWTEADVETAMGEPDTSTFFSRNFLAAERLTVLKDRLEKDYFVHHFRRLGGSTPDLCALLGLNRRQLYNRLKRLGISLRLERSKMDAEGKKD